MKSRPIQNVGMDWPNIAKSLPKRSTSPPGRTAEPMPIRTPNPTLITKARAANLAVAGKPLQHQLHGGIVEAQGTPEVALRCVAQEVDILDGDRVIQTEAFAQCLDRGLVSVRAGELQDRVSGRQPHEHKDERRHEPNDEDGLAQPPHHVEGHRRSVSAAPVTARPGPAALSGESPAPRSGRASA